MRALILVLGGAVAGFLLAAFVGHDPLSIRKAGGGAGAGDSSSPIRAPARQLETERELADARAALARVEAEIAKLREGATAEEEEEAPVVPAPAPGTRLPDGRIVGGAQWPPGTVSLAVGFLDNFLADFLKEAKLSPDQETRVRAEYERSIRDAMQIMADVINEDLSPDQAYEQYTGLTSQGLNSLRQILNGEQYAVFERFERGTKTFVSEHVISGEIAVLRDRVGLDGEQGKRVAAIVRERYDTIAGKLAHPLPNMFFRPVRRESDRPVYEETANRIREVLSPSQTAAFDKVESDPMAGLREFRQQLLPR